MSSFSLVKSAISAWEHFRARFRVKVVEDKKFLKKLDRELAKREAKKEKGL